MSALLTVADLACWRGGRVVFAGVGFALQAGDALALRGPNGSGKSSLLRLLAGLLAPAQGQIAWQGAPVAQDLAGHRARLHYVGHLDAIKPLLSLRENLTFVAALAQAPPAAVAPALAAFGLDPLADMPARFLSSGQRRRLALARLLVAPRPCWLLDEPGVGLDALNRARLEQAITAQRADGGIVILATHGDVAVPDAPVLEFQTAQAQPLESQPASQPFEVGA